ncbi:MAG: alpha-D-ribose 1-methylphosphonate 5-triphosphate diphosphatase [Desulfobacteraceae bacterium]|nr:MAG: alpha-D-ribose 1-methylphosphonate 5-triphosphate diphosphatase [Desulfobacteraceae bacterium]
MKKETILTNARIVTPEAVWPGTVRIREGRIQDMEVEDSRVPEALDLEGDYLLPGLIELHTDNLEKHYAPRPGVRWPSGAAAVAHDAALAAAGITTVFDALSVGDTADNSMRLECLQDMAEAIQTTQAKGLLRCEHFLHMRCEIAYPHVIDLFMNFINNPLVKLVSLMDHTPGQRQYARVEKLEEYLQIQYGFKQERIDQIMITRLEYQKTYAEKHRKELVQICRSFGYPIASHDDATVEHVVEAARDGIVISEFPTTLEAAKTARLLGMDVLAGAPNLVIGGSHSGNVSALELGETRCLNILSSDYVPGSILQGIFLLHEKLSMPLHEATALSTCNPARVVHLTDRGAIEKGRRADLIRVKVEQGLPVVKKVWRNGQEIF